MTKQILIKLPSFRCVLRITIVITGWLHEIAGVDIAGVDSDGVYRMGVDNAGVENVGISLRAQKCIKDFVDGGDFTETN